MKTRLHNARHGFSLVDLLVIVAVILVVGFAILHVLSQAHHSPRKISCTSNLKQVGLAFRSWAYDNDEKFPMWASLTNSGIMETVASGNVAAIFQIMSNELNTPKILFCPSDKKRTQATSFDKSGVPTLSNANVSYFIGMDARDILPNSFLSGDDNFLVDGVPIKPGIQTIATNTLVTWSELRHEKQGNIGLADGSVQGFSSIALKAALKTTGLATNRLAMP